MTNSEDINKAIEVVLNFTSEMNEWGLKCCHRSRYESDGYEFTKEKDLKLGGDKTLEELNQVYYEIFNAYCTRRERKYGGHPYPYGNQYSGITEEQISEKTQVNKSRIELICQEQEGFKNVYKFVLFKKNGEWLIDNAYWKDIDGWSKHHL